MSAKRPPLGRPKLYHTADDTDGMYDVVQCLGIDNVNYLTAHKTWRIRTPVDVCHGGQWLVQKRHIFRLRKTLIRLKREDATTEAAAASQENNYSSDDDDVPATENNTMGDLSLSADDVTAESDEVGDGQIDDAAVNTRASNNCSTAADTDSPADDDDAAGGGYNDAGDYDDPSAANNDPADDEDGMSTIEEDVDNETAEQEHNVLLKDQILELLDQQTRKERDAENDSSSESVFFNSDDDNQSTTSRSVGKQKKKKRNPRPIIVAEFESVKSNEVVVIGDDESSNDEEETLPIVRVCELIGNNQYTAHDLFTDNQTTVPAADDLSVNIQAEKSKGKKKSMQTLLKLQTEAQIKFIQQQDFKGNVTWTNVMKHLGYLLDLTQADMTVTLQFFKASGLDPALQKLPETGKTLLEPKRYNMKKARKEFQYVKLLS
jgi:hypothetical protein